MKKKVFVALALAVLVMAYLFQRFDFYGMLMGFFGENGVGHPYVKFSVNRLVRMLINDTACVILIWAWFNDRRFTRLASYVFLIEVFFLLPVYLWVKLSLEGDSEISSPILSQVHRMIVNPMLMFLLMVAFLYQRKQEARS